LYLTKDRDSTSHQATQAERGAQESAISLDSTRREADGVAHKVTLLEGELVVVRQAWDMAEAKLPGLVDKAVDVDRRLEEAEG
jgi:hypothetical protein